MKPDDEMNRLLHERFDAVLLEPIPVRLHLRRPPWIGYARAAEKRSAGFGIAILANLVLLIGALVGWLQHG